ncbi:MAG: CutA1 divalent ion tolerance protein [Verrucomicrobia bacterium]|nr:CutA1 divalent ion tolerance protein [Verrucomicrobiota bacterium]
MGSESEAGWDACTTTNLFFPTCATGTSDKRCRMYLAWTTVATRAEANRLGKGAVKAGLAVCAQIEGPIRSHYRWKGQLHMDGEFKICFKCMPQKRLSLESHVLKRHPYDTPEWIVVKAAHVGEKYLSWARSTDTNQPL